MNLKIEYVPIESVSPYERNVKKHPDDQIESIANSIKQFGWQQPIVVDKDGVVVIGHGRLLAAQKLGIDKIPVVKAEGLSQEQIAALRIADNKLSEKAIWDNDALGEELRSISDAIDMTDFGFGDFEIEILTGDFEPEPYDEEEITEYAERSETFEKKKRVIITYFPEQEGIIKRLFGIDEIKKVNYDAEDIVL